MLDHVSRQGWKWDAILPDYDRSDGNLFFLNPKRKDKKDNKLYPQTIEMIYITNFAIVLPYIVLLQIQISHNPPHSFYK